MNVARPTTFRVLWVVMLLAVINPLPDTVTGPWKVVKPVTLRELVTFSEFVTFTVLAKLAVPPTVRFPAT